MMRRSTSSNAVGLDVNSFLSLAHASSTKSIAYDVREVNGHMICQTLQNEHMMCT